MNPSTVLLLLATSTFAQVSAGVVKPPTNNASLNHLPPADAAWLPVPYEMIFNSTQRKGSEIFRGSNYLCQTSNASPLVADLVPCVAWLDRQPDWKACRQNNPWGSKCTQMVSYRGAALGVCGESPVPLACMIYWVEPTAN
ncbi:hypothetical protein EDC01DRAFT_669899 [Geopyxis carbonaria]|nr:hypothetical protein EDC01DRAFT_669899 [Geopyxis carbonaria]